MFSKDVLNLDPEKEAQKITTRMRETWSPMGKARGTSMFFGGIRRSIPSLPQGFGGLSSSHSSTAIGRGLPRRRINKMSLDNATNQYHNWGNY